MISDLDIMQDKLWELQKKLSDKKSMYDTAGVIINEKRNNTLELNDSFQEDKLLAIINQLI